MTPRDRRAVFLGAAVVGLAVLVLRLAPAAARAHAAARDGLAARSALLARMRADLAETKRLEDSGAVIRRRLASLAPAVLAGRSAADAGADLASHLAVAADRQGVRLTRTEPLPDSALGGGLGRVTLRATLESDGVVVVGLLRALAEADAVMVVDAVRLEIADPLVPRRRPELVRGDLTVSGWYLERGEPR